MHLLVCLCVLHTLLPRNTDKAPHADQEFFDFLEPSQAATKTVDDHFPGELCDDLFYSMTNNIKKCKYFDLNLNHLKIDKIYSLILLHVNICSLHKNFELLHEFLVTLNLSFDMICLTETRLISQPLINIELPHYKFLLVDTTTATGGVAIYISNKFQCEPCLVQYKLTSSECLWLEVSKNIRKPKFIVGVVFAVVGVVHRHPVQIHLNEFLESFSNCLLSLSNSKKVFISLVTLIST